MTSVDTLFAVLIAFSFLGLVVLPAASWVTARVLHPRRMRSVPWDPGFTANVIVPCYGRSEALAENLLAIARQDYPRHRVTFVTDTAEDDAVPAIRAVLAEAPHARHLVAGYARTSGQKIHVQLTAIAADPESEIFVICDSDMRPGRQWLRELVRPFALPGVLVTGSSRWIRPRRLRLGSVIYTALTSYWPMMMANPLFRLVWGGCFALSRRAFEELEIRQLWANRECDDLTLSRRLAERGGRPVFVPDAVSPSYESHESMASLVRWFTRQSFTGRQQAFPAFVLMIGAETLISLAFLASVGMLLFQAMSGAMDHRSLFAPILFALLTVNVLLVKGPYWRMKDMGLAWWLIAPVPGHLTMGYAAWRSVFVRHMQWGRVRYEFNRDGSIRRMFRDGKLVGGPPSP